MRRFLVGFLSLGMLAPLSSNVERSMQDDGFPAVYEEISAPVARAAKKPGTGSECQILASAYNENSGVFYILGSKGNNPAAISYENGRCSYLPNFDACCDEGNSTKMTEREFAMGSKVLKDIADLENGCRDR